MSAKLITMGVLAVTFGATSYYAGNQYLDNQTQARLSEYEKSLKKPEVKPIEMATIVVADTRLGFGQTLSAENLREIRWPADQVLQGSFKSIDEVISEVPPRALASISVGEPILKDKITGENARSGLAGIISPGMRAVTISVNEVSGVGGFVQPGDRVDIFMTNNDDESEEAFKSGIIMQNLKVLSIDQEAGDRLENARVASSVTLETDTRGAQKIALARSKGSLSLLLRGAGDAQTSKLQPFNGELAPKDKTVAPQLSEDEEQSVLGRMLSFTKEEPKNKTIRVINRGAVQEVIVPIEDQLKKQKQ